MKITTNAIIFLHGFYCVLGAYVKPDFLVPSSQAQHDPAPFPTENGFPERSNDSRTIEFRSALQPSPVPSSIPGTSPVANQTLKNKSTANLAQKVISTLRRRPIPPTGPNKQLFGGKLPNLIERIIQRIQNYFSVYNPPEYFEGSRPPATYNDSLAVICSQDVHNDSLSCDQITESEYTEECENISENSLSQMPSEDGYNIVVTHTVVHDNMINVYSPAGDTSSQVVSNVVVILEPSAIEYSPPSEPPRNRDKFYVYVNPTATNKKKDQYGTKMETQSNERPESFQPYVNATYTVIIRGDKLQEFSNNLENADNNSLNPEISIYSESSMSINKPNESRCKFGSPECKQKSLMPQDSGSVHASRSVSLNKETDVPNINVVLVPPDNQSNLSCVKNIFENTDIEYYILKPDNGSITRPKDVDVAKTAMYYLQKTRSDATSATYLPPAETKNDITVNQSDISVQSSNITEQTSTLPLLLNLFKNKPEERRES